MTKEQEDLKIASRWTLWAMPKKPSCLFDEVIVKVARNPELALKQNIVENNDDFWRKAYEIGNKEDKIIRQARDVLDEIKKMVAFLKNVLIWVNTKLFGQERFTRITKTK